MQDTIIGTVSGISRDLFDVWARQKSCVVCRHYDVGMGVNSAMQPCVTCVKGLHFSAARYVEGKREDMRAELRAFLNESV